MKSGRAARPHGPCLPEQPKYPYLSRAAMYMSPAATGMTIHMGRDTNGAVRVTTIAVKEPTNWPAVAPVRACAHACLCA
eukprot:1137994-Pelagomonas_calceolata.AAC.7